MPPDIRLSADERNRLTTLTRRTKITHRNVLLRWAFCRSMAEENPIAPFGIVPDPAAPPISWDRFAGNFGAIIWGLLRMRCHAEGRPLDEDTLTRQFRMHLSRGLGYLVGDPRITDATGVAGLVQVALDMGDEADRRKAENDGVLF